MSLRLALLQHFIVLALLAWGTVTPQDQTAEDIEMDALQQLGMLLGLPKDRPRALMQPEEAPEFVRELYQCLSSDGARSTDCVPGYHGSDVNQLRTSLGMEVSSPPAALHAFGSLGRRRPIKESLAISFNISQMRGHGGMVHYALLRVHREPVAADRLAQLRQKCGKPSRFKLRLYTQNGTDQDGKEVYSLTAVKPLNKVRLSRGQWVEFHDITKMYSSMVQDMQESLGESKMHASKVIRIRLELRSPTCRSISPSALGFSSTSEDKAQLVGLEETPVGKDLSFSRIMTSIAKQQHNARSRRQVMEAMSASPTETLEGVELATETPDTNSTATPEPTASPMTDSPTPALPSDYLNQRCKFYYYTVTFAEVGFPEFIFPQSYGANFCAGHCDWPLGRPEDFNKHAYIQSYANFLNNRRIPAPCCVPSPGTLKELVVVVDMGGNEFQSKKFGNMTATQCTCL